jgi:hypothetical protein
MNLFLLDKIAKRERDYDFWREVFKDALALRDRRQRERRSRAR